MIRLIKIQAVLNGFIVQVGCQTVVFDSREALLDELGRYLRAPKEIENLYREKALNNDLMREPQPSCEEASNLVGMSLGQLQSGPRTATERR